MGGLATRVFAVAAIVALAGPFGLAAQEVASTITGQASVVDGDTIQIHGQSIRLWGIDTPESAQTCRARDGTTVRVGQKASFALQELIGGQPVSCTPRTKDRYGRVVAACTSGSTDLSKRMISEGWGWAFVRYSADYVPDETTARAAGLNVWSMDCTAPWDWRRQQRVSEAPAAPQGGGVLGETAYVSAAALNIRECPAQSCEVVDRVTQGSRLIIDERHGGWARISTAEGGALGWASSRFLNATFDQALSTPPSANALAAASRVLTDAQIRRAIINESLAGYYGRCPCPYHVDRAGRSCGQRSAYSRPGGASPLCYPTDVTANMVLAYRSRR